MYSPTIKRKLSKAKLYFAPSATYSPVERLRYYSKNENQKTKIVQNSSGEIVSVARQSTIGLVSTFLHKLPSKVSGL